MAKGKKYTDAAKRFDRDQLFTPAEAAELVKGLGSASFDEAIELAPTTYSPSLETPSAAFTFRVDLVISLTTPSVQ